MILHMFQTQDRENAVMMGMVGSLSDQDMADIDAFYASQPMSENDKTWLRENVGAKVVASIIGTTEAGQIGYQSQDDRGIIHTAVDDYNYIEIVDDQGKAVPFGEVGRGGTKIHICNFRKIFLRIQNVNITVKILMASILSLNL